jgi:hypothetical protein
MEERTMKRFALTLAVATAIAAGTIGDVRAAEPQGSPVKITVKYTGKGDVDKSHRIWIWLFDTPNIGPGSMPLAELSIEKNGDTATFEGVSGEKVWVAAAYDLSGSMVGQGPPPSGTPVGMFSSAAGAPEPVIVGGKTPVTLTFDDSFKMP